MFFPAILYLIVVLFLIYRFCFFNLFKDDNLSPKQLTVFFFLKSLAIPAFLFVYNKMYGGIEHFDAGIFYKDAKALNNLAYIDLTEYLKVIFGIQNEQPGSFFYNHALIYTNNWDNGKLKDYFYNDNRVIIRLYSLVHFIAFGSYTFLALVSCFLSYIGLFYLYKAFKTFFAGKELYLFSILCFFPALWFYTGGLLKEGLVLFVMGCTVFQLKKVFLKNQTLFGLLWLCFLFYLSILVKPYLLCFSALCFAIFFLIYYAPKVRLKSILFLVSMLLAIFIVNLISEFTTHQNLKELAIGQQQIFSNASKGGLFLRDANKLLRLNNDTNLVVKMPGERFYTIKKNVPFIYWEHTHQHDTLYCSANKDTLSIFGLEYRAAEGRSNIDVNVYNKSNLSPFFAGFYYSLFYPLFYNSKNFLQSVASIENMGIVFAFLIILFGVFRNKQKIFLPLVFMFFALSFCLLVGVTTPNSGAIFRYRSPAVIFILLTALYYLKPGVLIVSKKAN